MMSLINVIKHVSSIIVHFLEIFIPLELSRVSRLLFKLVLLEFIRYSEATAYSSVSTLHAHSLFDLYSIHYIAILFIYFIINWAEEIICQERENHYYERSYVSYRVSRNNRIICSLLRDISTFAFSLISIYSRQVQHFILVSFILFCNSYQF